MNEPPETMPVASTKEPLSSATASPVTAWFVTADGATVPLMVGSEVTPSVFEAPVSLTRAAARAGPASSRLTTQLEQGRVAGGVGGDDVEGVVAQGEGGGEREVARAVGGGRGQDVSGAVLEGDGGVRLGDADEGHAGEAGVMIADRPRIGAGGEVESRRRDRAVEGERDVLGDEVAGSVARLEVERVGAVRQDAAGESVERGGRDRGSCRRPGRRR